MKELNCDMKYLKIITDNRRLILDVLNAAQSREMDFCLLTYDEDKNTHYLANHDENHHVIKSVLEGQKITCEDFPEKEMHRFSPLYDKPRKHRNFLGVGNVNLMPFSN